MEIPKEKPFYFFLDDYSLPMVKESTQRILNPIIFRRSADVIFKVATESVESFISTGLNGKVLEENDDYRLIDCGTLALIKSNEKDNQDILFSVLQPRIERHPLLKERNLDLQKMLGETLFTDEDRARIIRGDAKYPPTRSGNTKYLYQGWDVFASMWSSSIREMIDLFANMVASEKEESLLEKSDELISSEVQDKVYKDSGGQFISLLGAATDPSAVSLDTDHEHTYAKHLVKIVKAFHEIASYSLKYLTSKNQNNMTIKKARRIEITDLDTDLPDDIRPYYQGLIRYGVFIRDNRGKSVRGKIVPRLYLRSRLIPSFRLAFSKRDSITMNSAEFVHFLSKPDEFINYYKSKYPSEEIKGQISIWEDNKT